jgi:hypothetical protein
MAANDRLGNLPERLGPIAARLIECWADLPKSGLVPSAPISTPSRFATFFRSS